MVRNKATRWLAVVGVIFYVSGIRYLATGVEVTLGEGCACGQPLDVTSKTSYATDHILVKLRMTAVGDLVREATSTADAIEALRFNLGLPYGSQLVEPEMSRLARRSRRLQHPLRPEPAVDLERFFYLRLPPQWDPKEAVRVVAALPQVEYAELDTIGSAAGTIPADPDFRWQHHHQQSFPTNSLRLVYNGLDTPSAWDITTGSPDVVVAVLDSGVGPPPGDTNQFFPAEFVGRLVPGYNFVSLNTNTWDWTHFHGTQVAYLLGANANNGLGGCGVDWRCKIMPITVMRTNLSVFSSRVAQAIDFAVSNGCKVINFSGGSADSFSGERALTNAFAKGVLFVTAMGNAGFDDWATPSPASFAPVIAAGAASNSCVRASFSNYGTALDILAPAAEVRGYNSDATTFTTFGTSFAAPLVAGVCTLLASVRPDITQAQAHLLLAAGAEDRQYESDDLPGWDRHHGWGFLNAYYTLLLATAKIDNPTRLPDGRLQLSWPSPSNATNKHPFRLETSPTSAGPWVTIASTNFQYSGGRATWTEPESGSLSGIAPSFFRLRIALE